MPEVVTGARGPRDERERERMNTEANSGMTAVPKGKVVFQAIGARYRIQLTAPEERKLSDGRVVRDKPLVAQFAEHFLLLDEKKDAQSIELIKAHESYGVDFWDFADILEKKKQKQVEDTRKILADPEVKARILAELKASGDTDFALPSKVPGSVSASK